MQVLSSPTEAIKDASKQQLLKQGRHLWRGVYSVIAGAGPAHAVHFATYEFCKEKINQRLSNYSNTNHKIRAPVSSFEISNQLIASGTAGAIATFSHDFLMTPFDGK
jgi:solute carrier family 25 iron transporter 28/37